MIVWIILYLTETEIAGKIVFKVTDLHKHFACHKSFMGIGEIPKVYCICLKTNNLINKFRYTFKLLQDVRDVRCYQHQHKSNFQSNTKGSKSCDVMNITS